MEQKKSWFDVWFNTKYYHILYKNRNQNEASHFIQNLITTTQLEKESFVLDLACGKGRHAIRLNELGMRVLGVDLSQQSIQFAKQFENETLQFQVHDMREPIPNLTVDAVFNLFTSFGYFESQDDNLNMLNSVNQMLKPKGLLLIDFLNAPKVIEQMLFKEQKIIDGIEFKIHRKVDNGKIIKQIQFVDDGKHYDFQESVQALQLSDFKLLFEQSGFQLIRTFGNFEMQEYNEKYSDRLILLAQKK